MSIATEISRIQAAKADIKTAIEAKGVTVPSSATIDTYDDYVSQITTGGSSSADTALKGIIDRSITEIDIPNGTTSVGFAAFKKCFSLSSATIPSSVTTIGNEAFRGCSGLTSVNIPSSVTIIGDYAFEGCSRITNISTPSSVTRISVNAFQNCTSLANATINGGRIDNYAFQDCSGLTTCTLGSSVTSIGNYAFYRCSGLTSIDIPDSVTTIGTNAFQNCSAMATCTIGSGVTSIGSGMCINCRNLTSVTISSGVTSIGQQAFASIGHSTKGCTLDLSSIDLTNVSATTGFNSVFYNTFIKGSITIPNNLLSGSSSGTSSTCYQLFNGSLCKENEAVTINIYANSRIIPRYMCYFSNASTISKGNINIVVYGTPTFLSRGSFRLISAYQVSGQSLTFVDCVTPPNAESYGTSSSSPFFGFTGTVYVPSEGLDAWKAKYTGIADKIKAIPT